MPHVTIVSPFRDNGPEVDAYIERIDALDWPHNHLRLICVEGDSTDDTRDRLWMWAMEEWGVTVVDCPTHKPRFGQVVSDERFATLAKVFNTGLNAVNQDWSDYVLFLPSDIEYAPDLLKRLTIHDVDIVAAIVWENGLFYDTWAFMQHGQGWPKFGQGKALGDTLIPMDTVGGTMLSKASVLAAGVRYTADAVDRGYCLAARNHGFACWADPTTHVVHPDSATQSFKRYLRMAVPG